MQKKNFLQFLIYFVGGITIVALVLVVNHFVLSWTEPTANPPGGFTPSKPYALSAHDGDPADVVYVDDDGNVGIGTTDPDAKLEVSGTIKASAPVENNDLATKGYVDQIDKGIVGGWCRQKIRTFFTPYFYVVDKTTGVAFSVSCPPSAPCYSVDGCLPSVSNNYAANSICCECPSGYFMQPVGTIYEGTGADKWINYICIKE